MPRLPGPALVVGAVALMLFCVSAFDALTVVWDVQQAQHEEVRSGRSIGAAGELERTVTAAARAADGRVRPSARIDAAVAALRTAEARDGDGDGVAAEIGAVAARVDRADGAPLADVLTPLQAYIAEEEREHHGYRTRTQALTGRALRSDGLGMIGAMLLAAVAWGAARRRRRPEPDAPDAPAGAAPVAPVAPASTPTLAPEAHDPDGPTAEEVAAAVNRVRRQVLNRYTRAQADRDELAAIVDTAFDAFVGVDGEGRITRWNRSAERLFGWTREEAIGRPVVGTALGPPQGPGTVAADALTMLASARTDEPVEMLAWNRAGECFPVEVALSVVSQAPGSEVCAFVRDITRRRRADRRQRAIHEVTRVLAEAPAVADAADGVVAALCEAYEWAGGAVWALDEEVGVLRATSAWARDAVALRRWREASAGAAIAPGAGVPGEAWRTGGVAYREDRGATEDDPRASAALRARLRSAIAVPLVIEGDVVGVVELVGTAPRPVEGWLLDDLAAIQQVLASFVERRRATAASEKAKRHLLTLVSHELRTPLTSILGYVQMLRGRMGDAGEAERRSLEIIERNAGRLHRLVGDLLLAAEVSRGRLWLESGAVCLRGVVCDAADAARPAAEARGVRIEVDVEPVGAVEGDAGRLSQVLDNLLSNAIKFSHEGGRVAVRLREHGDAAEVSLRDEGIGVAAGDVEQVSEQFFRARTAQAAQVPGMGLGLSLSRAIVEGHGGELRFESVEGEGTTVTVRLPAAPAARLAAAA